ncbi:MAG: hypothetical protein ACK559_10375 [bacterium]
MADTGARSQRGRQNASGRRHRRSHAAQSSDPPPDCRQSTKDN